MFRAVRLSIIRSLFTVHSAMVYGIQVCRQLSSRSIWSCSTAVYKPVCHIPLLSVQWINSWWWTDELSETCRVSCQNKFVKLVHLVGFTIKKFSAQRGNNTQLVVHDAFFTVKFQLVLRTKTEDICNYMWKEPQQFTTHGNCLVHYKPVLRKHGRLSL